MDFELSFFESLILQELTDLQVFSAQESERITHNIRAEVRRIKKGIRAQALMLPESRVQFFIRHHQAALMGLSDSLTTLRLNVNSFIVSGWDEHLTEDVMATTSVALLDLLTFLCTTFPDYTDSDQKVPRIQAMRLADEIHAEAGVLRAMAAEKNLDPTLLAKVLNPSDTFTQYAGNVPVSYRTLEYMRTFNDSMLRTLLRADSGQANLYIEDLVVYLNFNSERLLEYFAGVITNSLQSSDDPREKTLTIKTWQKRLRQTVEKPEMAFNPAMPSLREQVLMWLEEECLFLEANTGLSATAQGAHSKLLFKVNTIFSVDQLGLILRLLMVCKIITNKNKKQVMEFFASHFTTIQQPNVSAGSLRTNSYRIEAGTYTSVRNMFFKMQDILQSGRLRKGRKQESVRV